MTTTNQSNPPAGASVASQTKKNQRGVSSERKLIVNQSKVKCFFRLSIYIVRVFFRHGLKIIKKKTSERTYFQVEKKNEILIGGPIFILSQQRICVSSSAMQKMQPHKGKVSSLILKTFNLNVLICFQRAMR
jgi:hypothetical protein